MFIKNHYRILEETNNYSHKINYKKMRALVQNVFDSDSHQHYSHCYVHFNCTTVIIELVNNYYSWISYVWQLS